MSVILFEKKRFEDIYRALNMRHEKLISWTFRNETGGVEEGFKKFIKRMQLANVRAWNNRYNDEELPDELNLNGSHGSSWNDYDLIKAFESMSYNTEGDEGDHKQTLKVMRDIHFEVMKGLVKLSPLYDRAAW